MAKHNVGYRCFSKCDGLESLPFTKWHANEARGILLADEEEPIVLDDLVVLTRSNAQALMDKWNCASTEYHFFLDPA